MESAEECNDYFDRHEAGEDVSNYQFSGKVKELPQNFQNWHTDNADRIAGAKSQPHFLRDNQKLIEKNVPIAQYGHKAGSIIMADQKLTNQVKNALNKDYQVATLTEEQRHNAKEVAEIVGADLKKPMNFSYIDTGNVNPKLEQSMAYKSNCALSVVTAEARARGINVKTLGVVKNKPKSYQLGEDMTMAWIDPTTSNAPIIEPINISECKNVMAEINKLTASNGRYYIGFDGAEASRALSAYRVKGKLYIYDQQINGSYDLLKLLKENGATSLEVLRLDNLLFDTAFIDQWITSL